MSMKVGEIVYYRMASSRMLRRVALVITDVSEEPGASFIRVTRIGELGTTQAVTSNRRTLRRNTKLVLTRATRRNIPEEGIRHSHRRENLKSYIVYYTLEGVAFLLSVFIVFL
jgi:hypothetical protein